MQLFQVCSLLSLLLPAVTGDLYKVLRCILLSVLAGSPYNSIYDLYDTHYEYETGDNKAKDEVLITVTPQFVSPPLHIVSNYDEDIPNVTLVYE